MLKKTLSFIIIINLLIFNIPYLHATNTTNQNIELELFELINNIRIENNIPSLIWNEDVANVARNHSIDMAKYNYFDHINLEGDKFGDRLKKAGIMEYQPAAENIAWALGKPVSAIANGWKNSAPHLNNILSNEYYESGVGIAFDANNKMYVTQLFVNTNKNVSTDKNIFADLDTVNNEFGTYVTELYQMDIIKGVEQGNNIYFYGNNQLTREQLVTMIIRAKNITITENLSHPFSDINNSNLKEFIITAYQNNIVSGYKDGTFKPNKPVTRGEASAIIVRAFDLKPKSTLVLPFNDVASNHDFHNFIQALYSNEIVRGKTSTHFDISGNITRFEISKILYKTLSLTKNEN